jgi:hypothetical protein
MADGRPVEYAAAAAQRVRDLGLVFPGGSGLRLHLAAAVERAETSASLFVIARKLLRAAVALESKGSVRPAMQVERLAAWFQEEAEGWPR